MATRALAIVERAYRGSVETQFADVLYLIGLLHRQLERVDVAVRGLAVTYALEVEDRPCITVGSRTLYTLPDPQRSLRHLLEQGTTVYVDGNDFDRLGLVSGRLIAGVRRERDLAALWPGYDAIWFL